MFKQTRKGLIRKFKYVIKGIEKELRKDYPLRPNLQFYHTELGVILEEWTEYDTK